VRTSISGDSLAAELGRYLNIDENTFKSSLQSDTQSIVSNNELGVHEQAVAAILEVVASNSGAAFEYLSCPEPPGGVQEWWTRMLSGSIDDSQSDAESSMAADIPESWRAHPSFGSHKFNASPRNTENPQAH
jgi:hypothetical protein